MVCPSFLVVWYVSLMMTLGIIDQRAESSSNPIYKIVSGEDDKIFDLDD